MHIVLLGVSHRTAPVALRERLDFGTRGLGDALARLMSGSDHREAAVLSTCNRAEVYVVSDNLDAARPGLVRFFGEYHGVPGTALEPHLYGAIDLDAVRHLFRVASGLDSLVVGEPQILGQVKDAFAAASSHQTTGPLLNRLFHASFSVGKRVRSETALSEGAVSVSYAAVALARKIFGDLAKCHALVVGAGDMGKLTAVHLRAQGVERITLASRTSAHASDLAAKLTATAIRWDQVPSVLTTTDIIVSATGSEQPVLTRSDIERVMPSRRHRPLFIIDIAVPRDVEPSAGEIEQVFLYNIDDLQAIVRDNLSRRSDEVARAEALVDEEVNRFASWLQSRELIPTVVALRQHFERTRQAELQRLEPKLSGLSPVDRARVDEITRLIVEKLLIAPTEQLKSVAEPERAMLYSDAVNRLFGLTEPAATPKPSDDVTGEPVAEQKPEHAASSPDRVRM